MQKNLPPPIHHPSPKPLQRASVEPSQPQPRESHQQKVNANCHEFGLPQSERASEAEAHAVEQHNAHHRLRDIRRQRHLAGQGKRFPDCGIAGVEIQNRQGGHISDTKRIHREHIYNRVHDFAERIIASGAPSVHSRKRQGNAERNLADLLQKRHPRLNVGVDTVFADIEAKDKESESHESCWNGCRMIVCHNLSADFLLLHHHVYNLANIHHVSGGVAIGVHSAHVVGKV